MWICVCSRRQRKHATISIPVIRRARKVKHCHCSSISLTCIGCGSWRWSPRSNKICGIHEGTSYGKAWTQLARPRTPAWRWIRAGDKLKTWLKQSIELLLQDYSYTMKWENKTWTFLIKLSFDRSIKELGNVTLIYFSDPLPSGIHR